MKKYTLLLFLCILFSFITLIVFIYNFNKERPMANEDRDIIHMTLKDGVVVIETRPDLAPKHVAQIKQLIEVNQQRQGKPQVTFNFTDDNLIKKLEVSNEIHKHITNGLLAIARFDDQYSLVPKQVAEKIKQRSEDFIVPLKLDTEITPYLPEATKLFEK